MTYRQFLAQYGTHFRGRVLLIVGGDEYVRYDAVNLLKYRLASYMCVTAGSFFLEDIKDDPGCLLDETDVNFRLIYWKSGILQEEKEIEIFERLKMIDDFSIIISESMELLPVFRKVFPKHNPVGYVVDCSSKFSKDEAWQSFVKWRFGHWAKMKVPKKEKDFISLCHLLSQYPLSSVIKMVRVLEAAGEKSLSIDVLKSYGLLSMDVEFYISNILIEDSKQVLLKYRLLKSVNIVSLLQVLLNKLELLLRIKLYRGEPSIQFLNKLDIKHWLYWHYRKIALKWGYKEIYRRMYLVFSLFRWAKERNAIYLLLKYW